MKYYKIETEIDGRKFILKGNTEKDVVQKYIDTVNKYETDLDKWSDYWNENGELIVPVNEDLFWNTCDRNVSNFEKVVEFDKEQILFNGKYNFYSEVDKTPNPKKPIEDLYLLENDCDDETEPYLIVDENSNILGKTFNKKSSLSDILKTDFEKITWNEILKSARIKSKLNQKEVAKKIGVNERTYQRLENGEVNDLRASNASKLCKLFNLDYEIFE